MSDDKTASKLKSEDVTDSVTDELINDYDFNKKEAQKQSDRIWIKNIKTSKPNKSDSKKSQNIKSDISSFTKLKEIFHKYNIFSNKSLFAEISSIDRTDLNKIKINLKHPNYILGHIRLDPDSIELANLLEYKSIDNPNNLEGEKLLIKPRGKNDACRSVVIPNKVSIIGKTRFAIFSILSNIKNKTKIHSNNLSDLFLKRSSVLYPILIASISGSVLSLWYPYLSLSILIIPFIWSMILLLTTTYSTYWIILSKITEFIKSDFYEINLSLY